MIEYYCTQGALPYEGYPPVYTSYVSDTCGLGYAGSVWGMLGV